MKPKILNVEDKRTKFERSKGDPDPDPQIFFATSAIEKTREFTFPSRCWWMETRDISAGLRQSMISLVLNYALICFISPINACIWTIFSFKLVI